MEILDINEIINLLFVLSVAASIAGFMAGLLGVGGGIIIVPALYYAFTVLDFDIATRMHLSVGTSLAIIIPTSIISTKTHMEYDAVDFKLIKSFGIFILLKLNIPSVKLSLNFIINSNLKLLFFAANKIFSNISSFETIKALGLQSLITYEKSLTVYVV